VIQDTSTNDLLVLILTDSNLLHDISKTIFH